MNALRGEAPLVLGGLTLTLKMGINALCAAEPVLGKKTPAILDDLEDDRDGPAMETVRVLAWAGLRRHHPEMHLIEVGELMDEHGPGVFIAAILTALKSAFGTAVSVEDKKRGNPSKARKKAGTG